MKKILVFVTVVSMLALMLAGCGEKKQNESTPAETSPEETTPEKAAEGEVVVYAAASLTESLSQIITEFNKEYPGIVVTPNFGSSGTLVDQIINGAECDIFISAARKQMNMIDITAGEDKNPDGNDLVVEGTRIDLLENQCVLAVPEGNPAGLTSFDDLKAAFETEGFLFAMGGESVPVGAYTRKIFEYLGLDEAALAEEGKITYGEDVKGVTSAVNEAVAKAGVIYGSDAFSAGLQVVATATEEMTGGKVIYPAALIKTGKNAEAAQVFFDFLKTETALAIFESVGFAAVK